MAGKYVFLTDYKVLPDEILLHGMLSDKTEDSVAIHKRMIFELGRLWSHFKSDLTTKPIVLLCDGFRMDLSFLFEQYGDLAREYEALANINNDVVEERNLFKMKTDALEAERDSLRLENESLKSDNKKQDETIFNLELKSDAISKLLEAINEKNKSIEEKLSKLEKDNRRLVMENLDLFIKNGLKEP